MLWNVGADGLMAGRSFLIWLSTASGDSPLFSAK